MASESEVGRYRTGMANLLAKLVESVGETELWLDVAVEGDEASARAVLENDPAGVFRIPCALLLRKAKIHMVAMLRANEKNNMHSLAVQMRPVLECAGQVVLVFHNLMIDSERGESVVLRYISADYYGTFIRLTKGRISHEELLAQILEASGMSKEEISKGRSLKQADKVAPLEGGQEWYGYLSNHFCHGKADWNGRSWQGGVSSINTVQDEFTFAGLMDYLVNQVAVMSAHAALCPVAGEVVEGRVDSALAQLHEVRVATKAFRDGARLALRNPDEEEAGLNDRGRDEQSRNG